jgi:hypothetical protein
MLQQYPNAKQHRCPRCKSSILLFETMCNMRLFRVEGRTSWYKVRCTACGDFKITKTQLSKLREFKT